MQVRLNQIKAGAGRRVGRLRLLLGLGLGLAVGSVAADSLVWHPDSHRVDADIRNWELPRLLEEIATATGWQVWVDPEARHTVSTKFKGRPVDQALELLLGKLSYVRLSQTNGPPKLLVFRHSQQEAIQRVPARKPAHAAKPIPNELIVRGRPGTDWEALAERLGAKIVSRSEGLRAARLQFKDAAAAEAARRQLAEDDTIVAADPNFPVASLPAPEALGLGNLPGLKLAPLKGEEGIIVALIDSAVQPQGTHLDEFLLPAIQVIEGSPPPPEEVPTHGTSMWETLLKGVAASKPPGGGSRVRVLPVDVYGGSPATTTFEVAEGIYRALQAGAGIINLSLGSEGDTPLLHQVIQEGYKAGRVFVASAGNEPTTAPTFPAAYPEVIAVTAGDGRGGIAPYANRGEFVDVIAPGTSLVMFKGQVWQVAGTSPATAFISGVIAGTADAQAKTPLQAAVSVMKSLPGPVPERPR